MKKSIVIAVLALGLVSCKKFLAEQSQSDVIPRTTKDFGEILYTNGYPTTSTFLQPFIALMSDDVECYNKKAMSDQQEAIFASAGAFQWQPNFIDVCNRAGSLDNIKFNAWRSYYQLILGTNVALQYLDKSEGSAAEKAMYKGEAFALRAFYHFMLVNLYAKPYNDSTTTPDQNPGIPLKLNADLTDKVPVRNSVKDVYTQVTADLDSAIYYLGKNKTEQKLFRISHVAAHLLASRIYLYMEKWDKVIENADYVIAYHPQLMNLQNWGYPDPDAKPIIGIGNVESIWYYGALAEQAPTGATGAYSVSHDLANTFDPNDLRAQVYFSEVPDIWKPYISTDFALTKQTLSGINNAGQVNMGSSWRSSEAYLNRAEAYIQLYKTKGDATAAQEALTSLNTLRSFRFDPANFVPWTVRPAAELLQMCRDERRREFCWEGAHRWMDLRRYGMPAIKHLYQPQAGMTQVFTLQKRDPQYVIPIPNEVLQRNPALTQNTQLGNLRQPD